jgi:membrane-bound serine protease (ClpP class)
MIVVGVALVLVGVVLLVAEAHLPAGVLGVSGGLALVAGTAIAIAGTGAGLLLALPAALGAGAIAALWVTIAARGALGAQALKASSGREAMSGRMGTVRRWNGDDGQVLVDGALWRARPSLPEESTLHEGDEVVVERVNGLTLGVRKAEEWESQWS